MSTKPTDWLKTLDELRMEKIREHDRLDTLLIAATADIKDATLLSIVANLFTNMKSTSHDHVRKLGEILDNQRLSKAMKKLQSKA